MSFPRFVRFVLIAVLLLCSQIPAAMADEMVIQPTSSGGWNICYKDKGCVGTLQPYGDNAFNLYKSSGDFVGTIFKDGRMQPPGRWVLLTAEDATLYLEALEAINLIKQKKNR